MSTRIFAAVVCAVTAVFAQQTSLTLQQGVNSYTGCTDLFLDMSNKSNTHAAESNMYIYGNGVY